MFAKLSTRIALHRAGINTSFSLPAFPTGASNPKDPNSSGNPGAVSNPFANISLPKGWTSPPPPPIPVAEPPAVGILAPSSQKIIFPSADRRPCIVVFLRYCGCPFAEKTILELRDTALKYPQFNFIAVSHCAEVVTRRWIDGLLSYRSLPANMKVVVDESREVYAAWGLGVGNTWYLMNPWTQRAAWALAKEGKGGENFAVEGDGRGNRWQVGGAWAVDGRGVVRWGSVGKTADERWAIADGIVAFGM